MLYKVDLHSRKLRKPRPDSLIWRAKDSENLKLKQNIKQIKRQEKWRQKAQLWPQKAVINDNVLVTTILPKFTLSS